MARREFPRSVKVAALKRCMVNGVPVCERCNVMIRGTPEFDHFVADGLGGEPTLENCVVMCRACHGEKTAKHDVPAIAKAKSREARDMGIRKRSRWPTAKTGPFKQKIGGQIVPRNP